MSWKDSQIIINYVYSLEMKLYPWPQTPTNNEAWSLMIQAWQVWLFVGQWNYNDWFLYSWERVLPVVIE